MRYANDALGSPPIGVEPQLNDIAELRTVLVCDYTHQNEIIVRDERQLIEMIWLLREAGRINGWKLFEEANKWPKR